MKTKIIFCIMLLLSVPKAGAEVTYDKFQAQASKHLEEIEVEGLSYMVGGGFGLASSLVLGVTSKEVMPKIGYSLIQTLSTAAIAHGAILYYTGDEFTKEAEQLRDYEKELGKVATISKVQRTELLNSAAASSFARAKKKRNQVRRIRGVLELVSAGSAGATMYFSKASGSASNITLGFIVLISTVGGLSDLLATDEPLGFDVYAKSLEKRPELLVSYSVRF